METNFSEKSEIFREIKELSHSYIESLMENAFTNVYKFLKPWNICDSDMIKPSF